MTTIQGGVIPGATQRLEAVLRRARAIDRELLDLLTEADAVREALAGVGVGSISFSFPPLVAAAADHFDGLHAIAELRAAESTLEATSRG